MYLYTFKYIDTHSFGEVVGYLYTNPLAILDKLCHFRAWIFC